LLRFSTHVVYTSATSKSKGTATSEVHSLAQSAVNL